MSGRAAKYSFTITGPSGVSTATTDRQAALRGGWPGGRRRRTSTSVTTSVSADALKVRAGRRMAPIRSARSAIATRASSAWASRVNREVTTATSPPGRVKSSDLTTKWLCIDRPARLWARSKSTAEENGTLPMTRSKRPSASGLSANDSARMVACG